MKKTILFVYAIFFATSVYATGIGANDTTVPCDNDTLGQTSGTANIEVDWQPNTINISWYSDNTQLSVQSSAQTCVYDNDLYLPNIQPTKTGYTFKGWRVMGLPSGYTRLDYLESTGTQYINTGVRLTSENIIFEWEAKDNDTGSSKSLFGAEDVDNTNQRYVYGTLFGNKDKRTLYLGFTASKQGINYTSSDDLFHSWSWVINDNHTTYLIKDGTTLSTVSWEGTTNKKYPIFLYGNFCHASYLCELSSVAFRYFKIIDNGKLVFNGIPARRNSDNVLGIYDTVSETFLTNAGSGSFVAGPAM